MDAQGSANANDPPYAGPTISDSRSFIPMQLQTNGEVVNADFVSSHQ